jgi:hypothetical protein
LRRRFGDRLYQKIVFGISSFGEAADPSGKQRGAGGHDTGKGAALEQEISQLVVIVWPGSALRSASVPFTSVRKASIDCLIIDTAVLLDSNVLALAGSMQLVDVAAAELANERSVMNFIWLSVLRSSPGAFDKSSISSDIIRKNRARSLADCTILENLLRTSG